MAVPALRDLLTGFLQRRVAGARKNIFRSRIARFVRKCTSACTLSQLVKDVSVRFANGLAGATPAAFRRTRGSEKSVTLKPVNGGYGSGAVKRRGFK